jgi:hypothetical protein
LLTNACCAEFAEPVDQIDAELVAVEQPTDGRARKRTLRIGPHRLLLGRPPPAAGRLGELLR